MHYACYTMYIYMYMYHQLRTCILSFILVIVHYGPLFSFLLSLGGVLLWLRPPLSFPHPHSSKDTQQWYTPIRAPPYFGVFIRSKENVSNSQGHVFPGNHPLLQGSGLCYIHKTLLSKLGVSDYDSGTLRLLRKTWFEDTVLIETSKKWITY